MGLVVAIIVGLVLGAVAYIVAGIWLPYFAALLIGVAVFLLVVFGAPRYGRTV